MAARRHPSVVPDLGCGDKYRSATSPHRRYLARSAALAALIFVTLSVKRVDGLSPRGPSRRWFGRGAPAPTSAADGGSAEDGFNVYGSTSGFASASGNRAPADGGRSSGGDELQRQGYGDVFRQPRSVAGQAFRSLERAGRAVLSGGNAKKDRGPKPGTLILVRHGESLWNANKTFTGWADPDLSPQGFREIEHAAR